MCGISGFFSKGPSPFANGLHALEKMNAILSHRGPDSSGTYLLQDKEKGISLGLAHTLLSIVGDKEESKQPFLIPGAVLAFNGIIYNYAKLRTSLQAQFEFRTTSDTEVLAYGLKLEGIEFLRKVVGFYALAFVDLEKQTFLLTRDPFGVKPLYLYRNGASLFFSSEYKSLIPFLKDLSVDSIAVESYLHLRYVPREWTLFREIRKCEPGHAVVVNLRNAEQKKIQFLDPLPPSSTVDPRIFDEQSLFDAVKVAIQRRAVADVPVASLLSGGIDSSVVCELLSDSVKDLHTYTLGFADPGLDESTLSLQIAHSLHLSHQGIPNQERTLSQLMELAYHLDDPYGDPIILALNDVFSFLQGKERVVVTGEGADELFSGYIHHQALYLYLSFPKALRSLVRFLPLRSMGSFLPYSGRLTRGDQEIALRRLNAFLRDPNLASFAEIFDLFDALDLREPRYRHSMIWPDSQLDLRNLRTRDFKIWLSDSQLFKLDKISMKYGIEAREPFVDIDLVRHVFEMNPAVHFKLRRDKVTLRSALRGRTRVSEILSQSRKKSFYQPLNLEDNERLYKGMKELVYGERVFLEEWLMPESLNELLESDFSTILAQKKIFALSMLAAWKNRVKSRVGEDFDHVR